MWLLILSLLVSQFSSFAIASTNCVSDPKVAAARICDLYTRYGDTKKHPFSEEARACQAYYEASFHSFNELCGFHLEAQSANLNIESAAKKIAENKTPADQAGLEKAYADILASTAAVFKKNQIDLNSALSSMEATYRRYSSAIFQSGDHIYSQWAREMYCDGGYRSDIPGFWLDGISRAMSKQVKIDHPRMASAILDGIRVAQLGGKGAEKAAEAARIASDRMGALQAPAANATALDAEDASAGPGEPHFLDQKKEVPIRLAQEVGSDKAIHRIHQSLPLPGWVKQTLNVGSGIAFYSWKDGFDAGTVVSATISIFGIPAGVMATVAETAIRNDIERRKYFRAWIWPHLKANPGISSKQVGENFCKELKDSEERIRRHKEEELAALNERLRAQMQVNANRMRADFECRGRILAEQQRIRNAPVESREPMILELRRKFPEGRCEPVASSSDSR